MASRERIKTLMRHYLVELNPEAKYGFGCDTKVDELADAVIDCAVEEAVSEVRKLLPPVDARGTIRVG